jgi:hypothetical protein
MLNNADALCIDLQQAGMGPEEGVTVVTNAGISS